MQSSSNATDLSEATALAQAVKPFADKGGKAEERRRWKQEGNTLGAKKDDTAAVLKSRLEAFHKQTELVINYLFQEGNSCKASCKELS